MKKKDEFDSFLSPSHLMRYPVLSSTEQDTWLISRLSPNSGCKEDTNNQAATEYQDKADTDHDSGLDSATNGDEKERVIQGGEMQEARLNIRARNSRNISTARPKIDICKVTKV